MNQKGFIKDIVILVLVALVVGYLFVVYQQKTFNVQLHKLCCVKDETADWKTYRNEKYGFEFKYPQGWFIKDMYPYPSKDGKNPIGQAVMGDIVIISKNPISFGVKPDNQFVNKNIQELINDRDYFTISHYTNSKRMTPSNWILEDFSGGKGLFINPEINTEISGNNRITTFTAGNYPLSSHFIFNGNDVFEFVSRPEGFNDLIFGQVISSFKLAK